MGHIYLSHPIAIYAYPIPWDVSHGIPIGMTFPWTSLHIGFLSNSICLFALTPVQEEVTEPGLP